MPDIDFGRISESLNEKSDRDLRNVDTTAKADAVIDYQEPTSANNYTWYRKYKSGWVEQGGYCYASGSAAVSISYPIELTVAQMGFAGDILKDIAKTDSALSKACYYDSKRSGSDDRTY